MTGIFTFFELTPGAADAALAALQEGAMSGVEITWWTLIIPIAINAGMLAYMLGGLKSQLDGFGKRIEKLEGDSERERDAYSRVDERVHGVAVSLARLEPSIAEIRSRVDSLYIDAAECPMVRDKPAPRRKRKIADEEPQ